MAHTNRVVIDLHVNGQTYTTAIRPHDVLLDVLRENLNLVGTRRGCDMGTCGCCTVNINGKAVLSCLTLAQETQGKTITTVEGLRRSGEELHPVQRAYIEKGGSQCGFCTSGFVMTTKAFLDKCPNPTTDEIKHAVSGNLCRCTGYIKIYDSVRYASDLLEKEEKEEKEEREETEGNPLT